ncbi:V-type ATPase assembly factor PKR1 [Tolypocladium capitatum]|uniref:V-type ATPase assembly factor PKR1 n=1 Tax=Tolypocladium capitatum TaxID=45235 RepID=A0A2K3QE72_9HYPO|nr:V-type ATPase assembly factor PKR1 [Tolypocladium capitatum]
MCHPSAEAPPCSGLLSDTEYNVTEHFGPRPLVGPIYEDDVDEQAPAHASLQLFGPPYGRTAQHVVGSSTSRYPVLNSTIWIKRAPTDSSFASSAVQSSPARLVSTATHASPDSALLEPIKNPPSDPATHSRAASRAQPTMASFVTDLWESIFTPGPTPTVIRATNGSFAALQLCLLLLLLATHSVHFAILSVLCAGLWWAINWFAAELAVAQTRQRQRDDLDENNKEAAEAAADDSSDTEVEGGAAVTLRKDAVSGELRQRTARTDVLPAGTQSSVSTEDEWEKVSESERDQGK